MAARTNPHGEHRFVLEYLSGWFFLMIFELLERCVSWPLTQIQVGNCENYLTLFCFFFLITCNPASLWWCFMLVGNVKMFVHGHGFGNGLNVEIWQMLYTWIPMDRYSCLTHTDVLASYLCLCSMAFLCLPLLQTNAVIQSTSILCCRCGTNTLVRTIAISFTNHWMVSLRIATAATESCNSETSGKGLSVIPQDCRAILTFYFFVQWLIKSLGTKIYP